MPTGLNRAGSYKNGSPMTTNFSFGNKVTLPKNFGNVIGGSEPTYKNGNPVANGAVMALNNTDAGTSLGTGYAQGDTLTLTGGNSDAVVVVEKVGSSGQVLRFRLRNAGSGYDDTIYATTGGSGSGATFKVTQIMGSAPVPVPPTAPSFVQSAFGVDTSGTSDNVTATFNDPTQVGSWILVFVTTPLDPGETASANVGDSSGNTYTLLNNQVGYDTTASTALYITTQDIAAGATLVTATFPDTVTDPTMWTMEIKGMVAIQDVKVGTVSGSPWSLGSITTTSQNELVILLAQNIEGVDISASTDWIQIAAGGYTDAANLNYMTGLRVFANTGAAALTADIPSPTAGAILAIAFSGATAQLPAVTFTPTPGTLASPQDITMTAAGSTAIYYTLDGTYAQPSNGTLYTGPVHITGPGSKIFHAVATATGKSNGPQSIGVYNLT